MNNSPSSDVFSAEASFDAMDTSFSYETLVKSTKDSLAKNIGNEMKKNSFLVTFSCLLEDCNICVSQSLELINSLLDGDEVKYKDLQEYMSNCTNLLKLLSNYLKNVMESIPMACHTMKTFPTITGQIIFTVFKHCKDSEVMYGNMLLKFERELKDLFRTCHELQLTYLMILDKHFVFDLTEQDEIDVLIHALEINLNIADLVHTLDMKTMGEQWKGVILLCEKYSALLADKKILMDSSKLLLNMIQCYLEKCMEESQDEKAIMRSMKMVFFAVKLLLRVSKLLKHATAKNYRDIIETLCYVYLHDPAYLRLVNSLQNLLSPYKTHVTVPTEALVKELVLDEHFINCLLSYTADTHREDLVLGYVLLLLSTTRSLKQNNMALLESKKVEVFNKVYSCVAACNVWCHVDLRLTFENEKENFGLLEFLLIHAIYLVVTFDANQYIFLEKKLFEAIISTDSINAMFASNLWVALSRKSNPSLVSEQVYTLCKIYQNLENHKLFSYSPQETHLRYTIRNLFKNMTNEEKHSIIAKFNMADDRNNSIWYVIEIKNMPEVVQKKVERSISVQLKSKLEKLLNLDQFSSEEFAELIQKIKLASSCSSEFESNIQDLIVQCWLKACPENILQTFGPTLDKGQMWYFQFMDALVRFTISNTNILYDEKTMAKVEHVISYLLETGCVELTFICVSLFAEVVKNCSGENNETARKIIANIIKNEVASKFFYNKLKDNKSQNVIAIFLNDDCYLVEEWEKLCEFNEKNDMELKDVLLSTDDSTFVHKCLQDRFKAEICDLACSKKSNSSNFDFADVDSIFDIDNPEPDTKKLKLQSNEINSIIERIECDTSMLCAAETDKISIDNRYKIKNICNKLNSLIN